MRARVPIVAVALVLATAGLAGCRTNVGTAATVNGSRISENTVNSYVTASAVPYTSTNASIRIDAKLLPLVLKATPDGFPTEGALESATRTALQGMSIHEAATQNGVKGYSAAFESLWVRTRILFNALSVESSKADTDSIINKTHIAVRVNPRYGTWDPNLLALSADGATPPYLTLQTYSATSGLSG